MPTSTMASDPVAACSSRSSEARLYTRIASVSKLNGRTMRVAGSSFITSTKTMRPAVSTLPLIIGT